MTQGVRYYFRWICSTQKWCPTLVLYLRKCAMTNYIVSSYMWTTGLLLLGMYPVSCWYSAWWFSMYRVPTQIVFSNSLCFTCPIANFPCANLHHLWLLHRRNWLGRPIQLLGKIMEIFAANIAVSFTFRIREQNSLCFGKIFKFPDRNFFGPFSLFSLCRVYPVYS